MTDETCGSGSVGRPWIGLAPAGFVNSRSACRDLAARHAAEGPGLGAKAGEAGKLSAVGEHHSPSEFDALEHHREFVHLVALRTWGMNGRAY
jgi:hypothetical protein